jgi:hypothetical protein
VTDREAIRRLADIVHDLAFGAPGDYLYDRIAEIRLGLAEPAVPTVTREQAQHIANAVIVWMSKFGAIHLFHDLPTEREMPAFFRAVADQLEKP